MWCFGVINLGSVELSASWKLRLALLRLVHCYRLSLLLILFIIFFTRLLWSWKCTLWRDAELLRLERLVSQDLLSVFVELFGKGWLLLPLDQWRQYSPLRLYFVPWSLPLISPTFLLIFHLGLLRRSKPRPQCHFSCVHIILIIEK